MIVLISFAVVLIAVVLILGIVAANLRCTVCNRWPEEGEPCHHCPHQPHCPNHPAHEPTRR